MNKERELYNSFVELLTEKIRDGEASSKDLDIIRQFLKDNNIQATMENPQLNQLTQECLDLPFDEDNVIPMRFDK